MSNTVQNQTQIYNLNFVGKTWLKVILFVAVFAFSYTSAITILIRTWLDSDEYSHGFLVPLITLYFIWMKREKLRLISIKPDIFGGLIFLSVASFMLITGHISGTTAIQEISIIVAIPGLVLMLLGTGYLKSLSIILSYLILMIPSILELVVSRIHWPFQLFSAMTASVLLKILNIPVFHQAQFLQLPNIVLEVAEECSGVRFLISIIAIAIPLAIFTLRYLWQRMILITLATVVGILTNAVRVALIGIWNYYGGEVSHGPLHIFQGFFVSVVGYVLLFISALVLGRYTSTPPEPYMKKNIKVDYVHPGINRKLFNRAYLVAILFLAGVGGYLYQYKPIPVPLKSSIQLFPYVIGDWKGVNMDSLKDTLAFRVKEADHEIIRSYKNTSGHEIMLYIAYLETQHQDKEIIYYRLKNLYNSTERVKVAVTSDKSVFVNKAFLNNNNLLILYWYDLNGNIIASRYRAKFITALYGLIHGKTNGAVIMISSKLNHSDNTKKVFNDEIDFAKTILPVLENYI